MKNFLKSFLSTTAALFLFSPAIIAQSSERHSVPLKVRNLVTSRVMPAERPPVPEDLLDCKEVVWMKVTAYCPCSICCGASAHGYTSVGLDAYAFKTGVAAARQLLPPGTVVEIPGAGLRIVDDTGGAMRQSARRGIYHIDLRCATHAQALRWGVRWMWVGVTRGKIEPGYRQIRMASMTLRRNQQTFHEKFLKEVVADLQEESEAPELPIFYKRILIEEVLQVLPSLIRAR